MVVMVKVILGAIVIVTITMIVVVKVLFGGRAVSTLPPLEKCNFTYAFNLDLVAVVSADKAFCNQESQGKPMRGQEEPG